jgi:hypothetical protein
MAITAAPKIVVAAACMLAAAPWNSRGWLGLGVGRGTLPLTGTLGTRDPEATGGT